MSQRDDVPPQASPIDDPPQASPIDKLDHLIAERAAQKGDRAIIHSLVVLSNEALAFQEALSDCIYFEFLRPEHIDKMAAEGHGMAAGVFWQTFGALLIFCLRTEAAAVLKLKDALVWSIAEENELAMALAGRSILEHTATSYGLARRIEPMIARLQDVWQANPRPLPTEEEIAACGALIRFAFGRRSVRSLPPVPGPNSSNEVWRKFKLDLGNVPVDQKSTNAVTELEKLQTKVPTVLAVYGFLSEYCHPNSASRTFDFVQQMNERVHRAVLSKESVGIAEVSSFLKGILGEVCAILVDSMSALNRAREPIGPLPEGSSGSPFVGGVLATDEFGRLFWRSPEDVDLPDVLGIELTDEQVARVVNFYVTFNEILGKEETLDEWCLELGKEPDPEAEIQYWEDVHEVLAEEMALRGNDIEVRFILYNAISILMTGISKTDLSITFPESAQLPDLDRVISGVVARRPRA